MPGLIDLGRRFRSRMDVLDVLPCLLVFVTALTLRGVYLWQLRGSPMEGILMGDAEAYDRWAQELASGHWIGTETFYQAPLYPYFLGAIYRVAGRSLTWVRLVQVVLGAVSCVFLSRAGREFFDRSVGFVAGMLLAFSPSAIFFDGLVQKSVLDLFLFTLVLLLVGRLAARGGSTWRWTAVGAALGGFTLARENALLLAAPLLLWLFSHFRSELLVRRLAWTGAFAGGLGLVLAPVALRNLAVGGELHLTTAQLGPNLYMGNNELSEGTYMPLRPGRGNARFERRDATELAEEAMGRSLAPGEVSRYWTRRSLSYVEGHFTDWLRLMARKCLLVWNTCEIGDTEDQYTYADWSSLLRVLTALLHFGVLLPLSVVGVCLTFSERRKLAVLYLLLVAYAASVVVFYVSARYRLPLVPILILFAAAGLARGADLLRRRIIRPLVPAAVLAVGVAVPSNWPMTPVTEIKASTYFNLSAAMVEGGQTGRGMECYQRALSLTPNMPEAHVNMAVALYMQGNVREAVDHLEIAVKLQPRSAKVRNNLAVMLTRMGRFDEAEAQYRAALAVEPDSSSTYDNLGNTLMKQGKLDDAVASYLHALEIDPSNVNAMVNLARTLVSVERLEEAVARCREAVRLQPGLPAAHEVLASALARQGMRDEAEEEAREARRLRTVPSPGPGEPPSGPAGGFPAEGPGASMNR